MRRASSEEDCAWEKTSATKSIRLLTLIVTIFGFQALSLFPGARRAVGAAPSPTPDFHDRLGFYFERKIAPMSMASDKIIDWSQSFTGRLCIGPIATCRFAFTRQRRARLPCCVVSLRR